MVITYGIKALGIFNVRIHTVYSHIMYYGLMRSIFHRQSNNHPYVQ